MTIYQKSFKAYLKNITKGYDILITTRIDYDDRIYYDAVNDVRKVININKPIIIHGYSRGVCYYEINNKYYNNYLNITNDGTMSVFVSLIIVLNKVNDTYTIYDLGGHGVVRKNLLYRYKSYGIKELNYEPSIFDSGEYKYVWVRQNYSASYINLNYLRMKLKPINFNLNNFYGE